MHSMTMICMGNGQLTCAVGAGSNAPDVKGVGTATAANDFRNPRYLEVRVSNVKAGNPGEGTIRILTAPYGGGLNWGCGG